VTYFFQKSVANTKSADPYPLRGLPYRYDKPFKSVAEDDWEALV
jgi:hypothetical protein